MTPEYNVIHQGACEALRSASSSKFNWVGEPFMSVLAILDKVILQSL